MRTMIRLGSMNSVLDQISRATGFFVTKRNERFLYQIRFSKNIRGRKTWVEAMPNPASTYLD